MTWAHPLYASLVIAALIVSVYFRPGWLFLLASISLALLVAGHSYIHYKHGGLKKDALIEYTLAAIAAAVVLIGATNR